MDCLWKFMIRMLSPYATLFLLVCFLCLNNTIKAEIKSQEILASQVAPVIKKNGAKTLHFKKLTIDDGLTTSEIRSTVQDNQGYIWIGTASGLNRYDGSSVKQYLNDSLEKNTLSNNSVNDLVVDSLGRLWIATSDGLNRYDEVSDSFVIYRADKNNIDSIDSSSIAKLFIDSNQNLWVGTRSGINRYVPSTDSFINYQYNENAPLKSFRRGKVRAFHEDNEGMIWIGTTSGSKVSHQGLTIFNPKTETFSHFDHDPNDSASIQRGSIKDIFQSPDGRIWVVSYLGGLSEYLPDSHSFRRIFVPENLLDRVQKVLVDSRQKIWFVTGGKGLILFEPSSLTFTQYIKDGDRPEGLNSNRLLSAFEDRDGLIWFGSIESGLNIFDYRTERFNHLIPGVQIPEFNDGSIRSVNEIDEETIVLGTSMQGIVIYNPKKDSFTQIFEEAINGFKTTRAFSVISLGERKVLVGTNSGVYILNLDNHEKHLIPINPNNPNYTVNILSIFKSNDGMFWLLSAGNGLFKLNLEKELITTFPYAANNEDFDESMLSSYYPRHMLEDDQGYLWIATIRGLNRFDRSTQTFKHFVHDKDNPASLPENKIYQIIEEDSAQIWLATNNGLILFNKESETFKRFTTKNGLPNNNIYCMVKKDNYLWLATNEGLSRWHRKDFSTTNYFKEDGLQSNEFNTFGCNKGKTGTMYFAGINGLNSFKAEDVVIKALAAPLLITDVKLEDKSIQFSKESIIDIPYYNAFIQLEFRVLDYSAPDRINYQIKLENFDKEWREIGNNSNTTYTNLSAGRYTFRVRASNQHGIKSRETQLIFNKKSHPLLSNWALSLYILILLSLIYFYIYSHQRQITIHKDIAKRESKLSSELRQLSVHLQNAREEERASIARELHDELAQILVAIKLEISWIQSTLNRDKAVSVLSRMPEIQGVVDACVESVRNMATGLRPPVLDDMGLVPALDWYVSNACQRANLRILFTTNCETIHLSRELSINVYRIVQETVTNVIKHANARKLSVSCYLKEQIFHLRIRDDGVGMNEFDMDKKGHYGLIGIRERVATYDGTVIISTNKPSGTVIDVTISVAEDLLENFPAPELN